MVGFEGERDRAREDVLSVVPDLSLGPDLVKLCLEISENAAVPLPTALRAALPPGIDAGRYRVLRPIPDHPWETRQYGDAYNPETRPRSRRTA